MHSSHLRELALTVLIFPLQEVILEGFATHNFATSTTAEALSGGAAGL